MTFPQTISNIVADMINTSKSIFNTDGLTYEPVELIKIAAEKNVLSAVREVLLEWTTEKIQNGKIDSEEDKEKYTLALFFADKINQVIE